ncbi:MAG: 16S rRNA (guanine(966)-N(2))-methyltransferase RsmD [Dehalococcoidales bacterium]|nr:16S rRNA (guanine(966)-N(2))-methyltransferase RsmD [Dehalococcoidales bacterium]
MRVIAGTAKGHRLKAPKRQLTRPATDLVKGAVFSILENLDLDWDMVLDLYSGSGQLGIEALSRGAGWVDFVDHSPQCCAIIKENLEKTKLAEFARVHCSKIERAFSFLDREYDIILIDPPYSDQSIDNTIEQLAATKLVGNNTIVVITHSPHHPLKKEYHPLTMLKEHRHGDSCISVYQKEDAA